MSPPGTARVAHLQQVLLKGSNARLTIDPENVIKLSPMSFSREINPAKCLAFSALFT